MPYGDFTLSKKLDDGGHRPLNSTVPTTSMAVVKTRVLRFSRLRIGEGGIRTPAIPTSCSDHDETGEGNLPGFLDVFPAVPSKRLCGFHGYFNYEGISSPAASVWRTRRVIAGERKTARKDCPSPRRLFVFPRRSIGGHSIFAPQEGKNSFPGLLKFQVFMRRPKGYICPWPLLLPKMLLPKMLRPNMRPLYVSPSPL